MGPLEGLNLILYNYKHPHKHACATIQYNIMIMGSLKILIIFLKDGGSVFLGSNNENIVFDLILTKNSRAGGVLFVLSKKKSFKGNEF